MKKLAKMYAAGLALVTVSLAALPATLRAEDADCHDISNTQSSTCKKVLNYIRNGSLWPCENYLNLFLNGNDMQLISQISDANRAGRDSPGQVVGNDHWVVCDGSWVLVTNGGGVTASTWSMWTSARCPSGAAPTSAFGRYSYNL